MNDTRPPTWFWVTAGLLMVWNLMGLMAFGYDGMITEEALAQMPAEQAELYRLRPTWVVIAFGAAVTSGTMAAAALLMRRGVAQALFAVSLVAVVVQDSWFFLGGVVDVMGATALVMPALVIASIVGGIALTRTGLARGWIAA